MSDNRKIATCCYCGTRAVLVLDRSRHELSCSACGAPLHDMKFMPQKDGKPGKGKPTSSRKSRHGSSSKSPSYLSEGVVSARYKKKKKKRKPLIGRVLEEIWDGVEDLFD